MTTAARLRALEEGQSTIAKKVLQFVPLAEAWTAAAITSEMRRQTGTVPDVHIFQGCLRALLEVGLIRVDAHRQYRRVRARVPEPQHDEIPVSQSNITRISTAPQAEPEPAPAKPDTLTRIATAAQELRRVANELDDIALEIEGERATESKEAAKLRQLKALLRDGIDG